jgi:hypothetical protein
MRVEVESAMNEAQATRLIDRLNSAPTWGSARLQRLFDRYNERFFGGQLAGWKAVEFDGADGECKGQCSPEAKQLRICIAGHDTDRKVRATLVHEMAHAVTNDKDHREAWLAELKRLRREGAPTDPMDFFVPYYGEAHVLVEDFVNAALAGVSWEEAFNTIFFEEP